jgi:hypothetical protein
MPSGAKHPRGHEVNICRACVDPPASVDSQPSGKAVYQEKQGYGQGTPEVCRCLQGRAAPRGAVMYPPRSGEGLEELSLDLMAHLDLERERGN